MIFLNLTAGLSAQDQYSGFSYIRIQSSHIESKSYNRLFYGLPAQLLYNLVAGKECTVVDCTSNNVGKVIKTGVPLIIYVLKRLWFNIDERPKCFDHDFCNEVYRGLSAQTKTKLRYYKKFLNGNRVLNFSGCSIHVDKEEDIPNGGIDGISKGLY